MVRGILEKVLVPEKLDELFEKTAKVQYTRELLFSNVVSLMSLVVCGIRPSVNAAYKAKAQQLAVSRTALYDKINGIEPEVSAQLVRYIAQELEPVVKQLGGQIPELLPGYRVKILDGNCLATTEHRLKVLRSIRGGALPGKSLVVLDPTDGKQVAQLYRERWSVETLFQVVTETFKCEIKTLGYPKAALFSFSMALVADNILSLVKAALRTVHGVGKIEAGLSDYYLAEEIQGTYRGMMIAIPPTQWVVFSHLIGSALTRPI